MKKTFILLALSLIFSGASFGAFHVEKTNTLSKSLITENSEITSSTVKEEISENTEAVSTKGIEKETKTSKQKSTMVAIILALVSVLILPFGFHNWYLGRTKQALWQTLLVFPGFILLGIPAFISWIWQIVDLILLLIKGDLD